MFLCSFSYAVIFLDCTNVHLQLLIVLSLGRERYLCFYTVFLYINKLFILV